MTTVHRIIYSIVLIFLFTMQTNGAPIKLDYAIGIGDGAMNHDGVTFRVELVDAKNQTKVLADNHWAETAWTNRSVDLSAWQGQAVILRFLTYPGENTVYDWASWGAPRITQGTNTILDLTEARLWRSGIRMPDGSEQPMLSEQTGGTFQRGKRFCGNEGLDGIHAHPPYKEAVTRGGASFGEFKITLSPDQPEKKYRGRVPFPDAPKSPFPFGKAPCFQITKPIQIDGSLEDWPQLNRDALITILDKRQMAIERASHHPGWKAGWVGPRDCSAVYYLGWDDQNLYIAEIRKDDKLKFLDSTSSTFSGSDSLRLGFASLGSTNPPAILSLLPEGELDQPMVHVSTGDASSVQFATQTKANGWTLEAAIPMSLLGISPKPGARTRFQLFLVDSDTPGDLHYELVWNPKTTDDHRNNARTFGTLTFCKNTFAWMERPRDIFAVGEDIERLFKQRVFPSETKAQFNIRPPSTKQPEPGHYTWSYHHTSGSERHVEDFSFELMEDSVQLPLTNYHHQALTYPMPSTPPGTWKNRTFKRDDRYIFEWQGHSEVLRYEVKPSAGFDVIIRANDRVLFHSDPKQAGPQLAANHSVEPRISRTIAKHHLLAYIVDYPNVCKLKYVYRIEGKTLRINVKSSEGSFAECRSVLDGLPAESVEIPYLHSAIRPVFKDTYFLACAPNWLSTGSSQIRIHGTTGYLRKTDGTRNPLQETFNLTVSKNLQEVLPNMPNPKSPFFDALADKVVLDDWGFGGQYLATARWLEAMKGYGLDEMAIIYHVWQHQGYDNALPEHVPADPRRGGDADMRVLGATAKKLGYPFSLHENYIDYYPNYPGYTEDAVALDSEGRKINAWFMPSTKIQSFRMKPTWIEKYVKDQSPQVHERYQTTAAYLDVHSVSFPWQIDFDARSEGAASMTFAGDRITWLFNYMRETHKGPLFGEGNSHALWAGRVDGCEAQLGGRGGELVPRLVDFDLLKVHPLAVNHGVGYYSRWHRERHGHLNDEELTKYRAAEIAYGHAGFLNTPIMSSITQTLREYYLLQPLQARYNRAMPTEIKYLFDDEWVSSRIACRTRAPRKVRVNYDNGLAIWINDERDGWRVKGKQLPPHGFLAQGPDISAWTARLKDGVIGDYLETKDFVFVDPRTYNAQYQDPKSIVQISTQSPTFESLGGRNFKITYHWKIDETPKDDYRIFVHFTDPDGEILWQQDHYAVPATTQWKPGTKLTDGPYTTRVPDKIASGTYDIRVGFFHHKTHSRLPLVGLDTGSQSYRIGRLKVEDKTVTMIPERMQSPRLRPGPNPYGTLVNFGTIKTDMAMTIEKQADRIRIMPIPHGHRGKVSLCSEPLLSGKNLKLVALDQNAKLIGAIPFSTDKETVSFETTDGNAWYYELSSE